MPKKKHASRLHIKGRFCSVLVVLLILGTTHAQVKDAKKFSRLRMTAQLRDRLAERFDAFVEYERTRQFDKQFDLVAVEGLTRPSGRNSTREDYVEYKRKLVEANGELLELEVKRVDRELKEGGYAVISARVKLQKNGSTYDDEPIMLAYVRGGDWYFTLTYFDV